MSGYVSNRLATKISFVLENDFGVSALPPSSSKVQFNSRFLRNTNGDTDRSLHATTDTSSSTCCICRSGSAADTQYLADIIRHQLLRRRILHSTSSCVSEVAHLIKNYLKNDESLAASLICAGYDHVRDEGLIYSIDLGGTMMEQRGWACNGSGSSYILGMIDDMFPKGIGVEDNEKNENDDTNTASMLWNEEEAVSFVKRAIQLAIERDGSSGGVVRIFVVNREGKKGILHIPADSPNRTNNTTSNLSKFAPATRRTTAS